VSSAALATQAAVGATGRARITRTGWAALGVAVAVGAAGVNTANNLLYLLASLIAGAFAVSWLVSRSHVARAAAELLAPSEVVAGEGFEAAVRLVHAGGVRPACGLVASLDLDGSAGVHGAVSFLAPGGEARHALRAVLRRRGDHEVALHLSSCFPFGLVESRRESARGRLLVLPASLPDGRRPVEPGGAPGAEATRHRGHGSDLLEIRDFRHGDDARALDWKATARLSRLMVREFAREEEREATLVLDPTLPAGPAAGAEAQVEDAISRAAGAAGELERDGWRLRLLAPGLDLRGSARDVVSALARVRMRRRADGPWAPPHVGGPAVHFGAVERRGG
jgi:uncharacterized protein (DUF58 family)